MEERKENKYPFYRKLTWVLYALIVVLLIVFLATVVASDNEEKLFYSLMTAVGSYVLRPTKQHIDWVVLRLFKTSPPEEPQD